MNPETFSKPTRIFLAIALPLIAFYAVAALVVMPILAAEAGLAAKVRQERLTLARYTAAAKDRPALEAALRDARGRGANEGQTTATAPSLAVAAARLQSDVRGAIANRAGRATSLESLDAEAEGAVTRVGVRVQGSLPAEEFPRLLHALEAAPAGLFIGDMTAASRTAQLGRSQTASGGSDELVFMLTVYRYARIAEDAP